MELTDPGGDGNVLSPFGELWLAAFKTTPAWEIWDACTEPVLFDICEPRWEGCSLIRRKAEAIRHPCDGKATIVSDFGLRITGEALGSQGRIEANMSRGTT